MYGNDDDDYDGDGEIAARKKEAQQEANRVAREGTEPPVGGPKFGNAPFGFELARGFAQGERGVTQARHLSVWYGIWLRARVLRRPEHGEAPLGG